MPPSTNRPQFLWKSSLITFVLFLSTTAQAGDLGYHTVRLDPGFFDWTGMHIGINGGYASGGPDADYSYNNVAPDVVALLPGFAGLNGTGAVFGGSVGYDIDMSEVVVGIEGDVSWANFGDKSSILVPANSVGTPPVATPPITFATNYQMDWLSTVRGRIGIPLEGMLIYGTGGLAFGGVSMNTRVTVGNPPLGSLVGSTNETKVGWTLGGGAEYALTNHVTVKAEVLYFDLGSISLKAGIPSFNSSLNVDQQVTGAIARAGIGYIF
jgi:outer membrane immunogenic protein